MKNFILQLLICNLTKMKKNIKQSNLKSGPLQMSILVPFAVEQVNKSLKKNTKIDFQNYHNPQ